MDALRQIQAFNAGREPERLALKFQAMRADTFAFFRGTCHLFNAQLPRGGPFKSAPRAWSCGDLHLANFGSYKSDKRLVYFDINDFDEAALGSACHDPLRLLSSLWVAADSLKLPQADTRSLCTVLLTAYADTLAAGKAYWVERDTASGAVAELLNGLRQRQRPAFLDGRTRLGSGKSPKSRRRVLRLDNGKALPVSVAQRAAVTSFMAGFAQSQPEPPFFEVLDVARRVAGTGSLGLERFAVLVQGKGSPDGNYLLDLKRAPPSSLAAALKLVQPRWKTDAQRIVGLQSRMQAVPAAFLHAVMFDEAPFVLRALHPSEDRIDVQRAAAGPGGLRGLVVTLGQLLAWAQLRSAGRQGAAGPEELIDFGKTFKWRRKLLDAAQACAQQSRADAARFNKAFDGGAFALPGA